LVERALDYEIEHYSDFRSSMKNAVEDRFLVGRGTAWVRYEPHIRKQDVPEDGYQITEDIEQGESAEGANEAALYPQDLTATPQEPRTTTGTQNGSSCPSFPFGGLPA
jgi:hypothetical protein